jgi:hypothetical protein
MLISDSIYLLNESLTKIKLVKDHEAIKVDPGRWAALTQQVECKGNGGGCVSPYVQAGES